MDTLVHIEDSSDCLVENNDGPAAQRREDTLNTGQICSEMVAKQIHIASKVAGLSILLAYKYLSRTACSGTSRWILRRSTEKIIRVELSEQTLSSNVLADPFFERKKGAACGVDRSQVDPNPEEGKALVCGLMLVPRRGSISSEGGE
ncbi:hypothetical protein Dimus_033480 [Dionaea muscipula]